jgi:mannose-1-phosphate guanylyltransferase
MHTPKQLLNIIGNKTMLRETVARLAPIVPLRNFWVVTNAEQSAAVRRELHGVPANQILAEPVGRNTAAAIALAAIHLQRKYGDAVMAVLPADSYIADATLYRKLVRAAVELARTPGNMVVLGLTATRPETGYGYIERSGVFARPRGVTAYQVRRFSEKPSLPAARKYLASGKHLWNAGMFVWRASTFLHALERFLPATHAALMELAKTIRTPRYAPALRKIYPRLENISVDYAVMEPATQSDSPLVRETKGAGKLNIHVSVIPAKVGWSDIGSWAAVHELRALRPGANVSAGPMFAADASGNYFWSPKKFVAAIGVHDLVLVETDDAILLCPRERSQEVGKIVKWLEQQKHTHLL